MSATDLNQYPFPSQSMTVAAWNADFLDKLLNGTNSAETDRRGTSRITWTKVEADYLSFIQTNSIDALTAIKEDTESARDAAFAALSASGDHYETKAAMDSVTGSSGDFAIVWNDSTADNNAFYGWSGSSWEKSLYDPVATALAGDAALQAQINILKEGSTTTAGASIRFYERNLRDSGDSEKFGTVFQSKDGLPPILGSGNSMMIKARLPQEMMAENSSYQVFGHARAGGYFNMEYVGSHYFSDSLANTIFMRLKRIGGDTEYEIATTAFTEKDVLLYVEDDGANINLYVHSCVTGNQIATGTVVGTIASDGIQLYRDGISFGAADGNAAASSSLSAPNSGFIGSLSDFAILSARLSEVQRSSLAINDTKIALIDFYGAGSSSVGFFRQFHGKDGLSDCAEFPSDADDSVIYGSVNSGSSIGKSGVSEGVEANDFYVEEKIIGFIAAIEHPGATSARVKYDITVDAGSTDPIFCDIYSSTGAKIRTSKLITPNGTDAEYTAYLDLPVRNEWMTLRFYNSAMSHYHNNGITAGVVVCFTTQSQGEIAMERYDAGLEKFDRVASILYFSRRPNYTTFPNVEIIDSSCIRDGIQAWCNRWFQLNDIPIMIVANCDPGTGVDEWLDDSNTDRSWSDTVEMLELCDKRVSCILWMWVTNNLGAGENYARDILTPLIEGIPATGTAPLAVPVVDHYLYDGIDFEFAPSFIISPPTGHRMSTAGPFDYDAMSEALGKARDSQVQWAESKGFTVGPFINDLLIANGGSDNSGGPHQHPFEFRGNPRVGIRLGEALARWNGSSNLKNPTVKEFRFADATSTIIDMEVNMVNFGRLQTDGGDIEGIEISVDGGTVWSRSGFSAAIHNSKTVRLTIDSGTWPATTKIRYQAFGPFAYGTSVDELTTIRGALYDAAPLDGSAIGDGLGVPVAGSTTVYDVLAFS